MLKFRTPVNFISNDWRDLFWNDFNLISDKNISPKDSWNKFTPKNTDYTEMTSAKKTILQDTRGFTDTTTRKWHKFYQALTYIKVKSAP